MIFSSSLHDEKELKNKNFLEENLSDEVEYSKFK